MKPNQEWVPLPNDPFSLAPIGADQAQVDFAAILDELSF